MSDITPFDLATSERPSLAAMHTAMHAGVCRHCCQWAEADDVYMLLPSLDRVVCLRCAETITGTPLRLSAKLRRDAIEAAGRD